MNALLWCMMGIVIAVSLFPVIQNLHLRLAYDDRPALILHQQEMLTPVIPVGGTLIYTNRYSKRSECHPPMGNGEVVFRLIGVPDRDPTASVIFEFDMRRPTRWPVGDNLVFKSETPTPPDIPPGTYMFEQISTYVCADASKPQTIKSSSMRVKITA